MDENTPVFKIYQFKAMDQSPKAMFISLLFQVASHEDFQKLSAEMKKAAFEYMVKAGEHYEAP